MQMKMIDQDEKSAGREMGKHTVRFATLLGRSSIDGMVLVSLFAIASLLLVGCQSTGSREARPSDVAGAVPLELTTEAYNVFVQGNCTGVQSRLEESAYQDWPSTEVRYSLQLLSGFCQELADQRDAARETYREIVREAPLSFASDDARERLRIMRIAENDPDYEQWVESARARALEGSTARAPIERTPASYPPLPFRAGIEGYAIVEFGVTPRGATDSPVVVESDPPLLFDGVAVRAVRSWRYAKDSLGDKSERQAIRLVFRPDEDPEPETESGY